jgi:hypothetical protein
LEAQGDLDAATLRDLTTLGTQSVVQVLAKFREASSPEGLLAHDVFHRVMGEFVAGV